MTIIITQEDKILRKFDYTRCIVDSYNVNTFSDREEGWTGKSGTPY